MRKYNPARNLTVHHKVKRHLARFANSHKIRHNIWQRSNIILEALKGVINLEIGALFNVSRNVVARWVSRFMEALPSLNRIAKKAPESLASKLIEALSDNPRTGRPSKFDEVSRAFIVGVACNNPSDYGFVRSHWSLGILRTAIIASQIVPAISRATINRVLRENDLRPHKNRYWLHSQEKGENPFTYKQKIQEINGVYFTASMINQFGGESDLRIISTDEMTGIQALEHRYPDKPARPHMIAKTEFEYIRHGTTSLIGFFDVVSGKMVCPYLNKTRKAVDFTAALSKLIESDPDKNWIIIADNLNTHYSEQVARFVADRCGISDAEENGCFLSQKSRIEFLIDPSHKIRLVFTPKHCSWMNQIEIWFGIINRQLLRRKSFISVDDLERNILDYIEQYNSMFAHPFKWMYHSTPIGTSPLRAVG